MTTNNEELRPKRNYDNANDERHHSSNGNRDGYNRERRTHDGGYHSPDRDRSYNQNYRSYDNSQQGNSYGNNQDGMKKRRVRVGERTSQQGSYGERRSYGNADGGSYGNRDNRPPRPYNNNRGGQGQGYGERSYGDRNYNERSYGDRSYGERSYGDRNYGDRNQPYGERSGPNRPFQSGGPKKLVKKKKQPFKQIKYKENADPHAPLRLNKYLSNAGICSRREADEFIQAGVVKVNGVVITELGTKITRADAVLFHDQPIQPESKVYVLLNKPKGFVTTTDDPENRKTVMDLVKSACAERIYPVGRLDRSTTGVLLFTNDGDLASKLTHPKYEKRKIYQVWLDKPVAMDDMQKIADGIELEDGEIHADAISYVTEEDLSVIGIEIHSGRNRIVRRIFEKLGYRVVKLDRVYFAGLTKKKLARGKWRYLSEKEVNMLRMGAFD
jgi:23S rRNA pseudouridine2605 synthase